MAKLTKKEVKDLKERDGERNDLENLEKIEKSINLFLEIKDKRIKLR